MKTSNKLLLIVLAIILSGMFYSLYRVKSFVGTALSENGIIADNVELTGEISEVGYDLDEFEIVEVNGAIEAKLKRGDKEKIVLRGDTALFRYVDVKVKNDKLEVSLTKIKGKKVKLEADIFMPKTALEKVVVNAGGQLSSNEIIKVSDIEVEANAGGFVDLELNCENVECMSNAGAQVTLTGVTERLEGSANAGAFIKAKKLKAERVSASANAGGQMFVSASEKLDASCVAGGIIVYSGDPKKVSKNTMLGGVLTKN